MPRQYPLSGSTTTTWVGYLTILGVAILGWGELADNTLRLFALVLLGMFVFLFQRSPETAPAGWQTHVYLSLQTVLVGALMALLPGKQWIFAIPFFVLSSQAVTLLPSPLSYAWIGVFTLTTAAVFTLRMGFPAGLYDLVPFAGGYLFFGAFSYAWSEADGARRENQRLLNELAEEHRRLQEYAARVEALTEAQERSRIAREIHDILGHTLTTLDVQLELLKRLPARQEEQRDKVLRQAQELVRQGLADTRRAVRAMQPVGLESLSLYEAIESLVNAFQESSGIPVDWQKNGDADGLSPRLVLPLYRVAQEALTNIRRHAATTPAVTLRLENDGQTLHLTIDNAPPAPPAVHASGSGQGLKGLCERIEALGGSFSAGPTPAGGFQVDARIPQNTTFII